jgi:hypothetical protein
MDVFSFSTIIVVLFLIIGAYVLLTGQIEGRAKIVLIVAVLVSFILLFINLPFFKSYKEGSTYPISTIESVPSIKDYEMSTTYTLSMWVFINDWNDKLGSSKIICKRNLGGDNPKIYLDSYKNNLKIDYCTTNGNSTSPAAVQSQNTIEIEQIGIQKWNNIVVCFGDNKIDTYINGKLEKSTVNDNPQYSNPSAKSDAYPFIFCPTDSTYNGYISATRYYPKFLSPQEVWDVYKEGFSNNILGNFFNQYNATFKFTKNQTVLAEFPLM